MLLATSEKEFDPSKINVTLEVLDESLNSIVDVIEVFNASPIIYGLKR